MIPFDRLQPYETLALGWWLAALAVSLPAAIAAISWVRAWRGQPAFGPPRCPSCRSALRGRGLELPPHCPECGEEIGTEVEFGLRSWNWALAGRSFVVGLLAVGFAVALALWALRGANWIVLASRATSHAGGMEYGLRRAGTHEAAAGALFFAADTADGSAEIRPVAARCLTDWLDGRLSKDRGLELLFAARSLSSGPHDALIDLVGSLVEHGDLEPGQAAAILERAIGPATVMPAPRSVGPELVVEPRSPNPAIEVAVTGVSIAGRELEPEGEIDGHPQFLVRGIGEPQEAVVRYRVRFLRRAAEGERLWHTVERASRWRIERGGGGTVARALDPLPPSVLLRVPSIAIDLRPAGAVARVTVGAHVDPWPGWTLDGTWIFELGEARIEVPTSGVRGDAWDTREAAVPALADGTWPRTARVRFEPRNAGETATATGQGWAWPRALDLGELSVIR